MKRANRLRDCENTLNSIKTERIDKPKLVSVEPQWTLKFN